MKPSSWLGGATLALLLAASWAADFGSTAGVAAAVRLRGALAPLRREPLDDAGRRHFRYEALFEEVETTADERSVVQVDTDDVLYWKLNRGKRVFVLGAPFDINADGMRDKERAKARARGFERIAFLGASLTVGYGVTEPETFVRRLERRLNAEGPAYELLNFGVPGYSPVMFLEQYSRAVAPYRPDRVVLCLNVGAFRADLQRLEKAARWRSLVKRKLAYDSDYASPAYLARVRELAFEAGVRDLPSPWTLRAPDAAHHPERDAALLAYVLSEFKRRAAGFDAAVVAVILPVMDASVDRKASSARLRAAALKAGIEVWDLSESFGGETDRYRLAPGDGHLNAAAHALIADELLRRLRSKRR